MYLNKTFLSQIVTFILGHCSHIIVKPVLSNSRLDLLKFKIKCEENNLKCVKEMFKKQVKIVVKKTDYNKSVSNIELIKKLISPKVILFKCDDKYGRKQK